MRLLNTNIHHRCSLELLNFQSSLSNRSTLFSHSSLTPNSFQCSFQSPIPCRMVSVMPQSTEENFPKCRDECPRKNSNSKEELRSLDNRLRNSNPEGFSAERNRGERGLWALFGGDDKEKLNLINLPTDCGNEDPSVVKELSLDMQIFAHHLYMEGYLKGATFMPHNGFDLTRFEASHGREFLKSAAVKFGKHRQCITKWLPNGDLKTVSLFGCPSLGRKSIHSAKHMRIFLGINEHTVCQKCTLKHSCKFAYKKPKKAALQLHLASVIRVLVMYALESVPARLIVPAEIKNAVSRLLNEIIKLSRGMP